MFWCSLFQLVLSRAESPFYFEINFYSWNGSIIIWIKANKAGYIIFVYNICVYLYIIFVFLEWKHDNLERK